MGPKGVEEIKPEETPKTKRDNATRTVNMYYKGSPIST
jgi:hypothetical protein